MRGTIYLKFYGQDRAVVGDSKSVQRLHLLGKFSHKNLFSSKGQFDIFREERKSLEITTFNLLEFHKFNVYLWVKVKEQWIVHPLMVLMVLWFFLFLNPGNKIHCCTQGK